MARHGKARLGMATQGKHSLVTLFYGADRQGAAGHGEAWRG